MIDLTDDVRQEPAALLRRHSTPQQFALRARIVLAAAAGQTNGQVVRQLGVSRDMVRRSRQRWRDPAPVPLADLPVAERLADGSPPGRPARIPAAAVFRIVALAGPAPATSGRPISPWSSRAAAEVIKQRGRMAQMAPATPPGPAGSAGSGNRRSAATGTGG